MKTSLLLVLGCSLAALAAGPFVLDKLDPDAAGMSSARLARIPVRMKEFVTAGKTAGVVTLVARHGHVASLDAVGYQDLESKTPMRTDTIFRLASVTKPVTCAGIMILVDEGRVSLIDPVEKYLPEFKGLKLNQCGTLAGYNCATVTPSRPVNILDLMTHTSGLPGSAPERGTPATTLAEHVAAVSRTTLLFEPGTAWNYSNIGIAALGRVIEVVTGQPYDRFLAERIFQPLEMKDTFFFVPADKASRVASVYTYETEGLKRVNMATPKYPAPEGGLFSTASDMARFHQMMLQKGTLNGQRILSAAGVEAMTTSQTGSLRAGFAPGVGHGFGFEVVRETLGTYRYNSIGSFVKGGAYRTYGWVDPAKDLVGIIFMQRTNGGGDVADEINSFMAMSAAAIER
ncbi:MAG TPA: serine hydrolase domain-containing protein [Candidatus Sulfopaludibacter sp.]|jgi:CubicO group peptidase (beta-lactamase class C family)|nr:serine hydrolase domain-containing protein [Candidatus Sulfopaludibacter sp.]